MEGWNKEAIKQMTKKEFVDMHQHYKDDVDLEAEYDKIVPPKRTHSELESIKKVAKK